MNLNPKTASNLVRAAITALILSSVFFATQKTGVTAQGSSPMTCAQLVPVVQKKLASSCQNMDRDEICLGYPSVAVQFQDGKDGAAFKQVGDTVPVNSIKSISTAPLNLERGEWGLAVLKTQATVPNTTAGQAVTFVLYGDTTLNTSAAASSGQPSQNAVNCTGTTTRATNLGAKPGANTQSLKALTPGAELKAAGRLADSSWVLVDAGGALGWLPAQNLKLSCDAGALPQVNPDAPSVLAEMGAFYFSTGISAQADCKDVPSGLMIQSPTGSTVKFKVNGVSLTIGSSVVLRAQPKQKMIVAVLKGKAVLETDNGQEEVITEGQEASLPLGGNDGLTVDGPPDQPEKIDDPTLTTETACGIVDSVDTGNLCSPEPTESAPNAQATDENNGQSSDNNGNSTDNSGQSSATQDGSSVDNGGNNGNGTDNGTGNGTDNGSTPAGQSGDGNQPAGADGGSN